MHAGIAGAGLVGRLLAWRLQQAGWQVTLFDQGHEPAECSAAYVAAGMLSPSAELQTSDARIYHMGKASLLLWQQWLPLLSSPVFFQQRGSLVVAHAQDHNELQQFTQLLQSKINNPTDLQVCSHAWLQQHEPDLNFSQALFLTQEGQINTRELLWALYQQLNTKNTTFHFATTVSEVAPGRIVAHDKAYHFDWVFDCRGYGADGLSQLRNIRGEIIYLQAPAVHITRPVRLLHPRYHIYIVPRTNNLYLIGATEIEADDDSPISVRSCLELLSAVYSVNPGFAEARILATHTAKRAAFPDNLPQVLHQPGLTAINGLYRHGFLLAPVLVEEVSQLLLAELTT